MLKRQKRTHVAEDKIIDAIIQYEDSHDGLPPTAKELSQKTKMKYPTLHYHLISLKARKFVDYRKGIKGGVGRYGTPALY